LFLSHNQIDFDFLGQIIKTWFSLFAISIVADMFDGCI